ASSPTPARAPEAPALAALPATARILLADDNADMREYVVRLLGDRWTVDAVADGAMALAHARANAPDLVLADIMMPGLDGFALLRELRADERTRAVPVIFLSARAGEEARIEGLHAGADDYLAKPFSARELLARVSTHLELSRLRREAERARARLYLQLMQAPVAISVAVGPDFRYELANPLYEEMLGRKNIVGKTLLEAFPELNDDAPALQMWRNVCSTGEPFTAEEFCIPLDRKGSGRLEDAFFKFTSSPMRDASDVVTGVMTVAVEVTEQVRSRRALEVTQQKLTEQNRITETLNRIGSVLNAELDLPKILQTLTDEATALCRAAFGAYFYNVVDESGESYMLYALAGIPREAFANFPLPRNTAVFGPTFRGEGVVRSDDITKDPRYGKSAPYHGMPKGHPPLRSYLAVPVISRGVVLGGLFFGHPSTGAFTEQDERVITAAAAQAATAIENARLYQQAQQAEARTAKLQAITAALSHAITPTDAAQTIIREVMPILGAASGVVMMVTRDGAHLEVFAADGLLDDELMRAVQRIPIEERSPACDAARTGELVWVTTTKAIRERNPELAYVQKRIGAKAWGAVPLIFEGKTIGVASFQCTEERPLSGAERDFLLAAGRQCAQAIERARLYEEARHSRAEAETASQAKDEFLAMLGHELRNPLAPILTALQLMRLRGDDSLNKERTVIERQVSHVVRLVDDLLDVSRITRGKVELKRQPVELAEVVAKAIEMASPLLEERHHALDVNVPRSGLCIDGDQVRLAQVVSNLLNNAAKYTPANGRIVVTALREQEWAVLRVSDSGVGLSAEFLPRVFELFVQERQSIDRSQGGLGLGLAIVRSLVELHGGTVAAQSAGRDQGSDFIVRLPLAIQPGERAAPADARPAPALEPLGDGLRVLVVDDNVDAADLLAESLRTMGYQTAIAYDGPEALRVAAQFEPQIALLDIGLPVMDGYELAQHLRRVPGRERLRLVAITGYGQDSDRARSERAGFDSHLVKPINLDQIGTLLDTLARTI
ncbi:MAG: two-component hybrid sensor and regulator, partial [Myxococcales bacterium]|nr:two-component hybrid sensor and regulator [Myxococcales bacterium]